jgi:hypothetical protein
MMTPEVAGILLTPRILFRNEIKRVGGVRKVPASGSRIKK